MIPAARGVAAKWKIMMAAGLPAAVASAFGKSIGVAMLCLNTFSEIEFHGESFDRK